MVYLTEQTRALPISCPSGSAGQSLSSEQITVQKPSPVDG